MLPADHNYESWASCWWTKWITNQSESHTSWSSLLKGMCIARTHRIILSSEYSTQLLSWWIISSYKTTGSSDKGTEAHSSITRKKTKNVLVDIKPVATERLTGDYDTSYLEVHRLPTNCLDKGDMRCQPISMSCHSYENHKIQQAGNSMKGSKLPLQRLDLVLILWSWGVL